MSTRLNSLWNRLTVAVASLRSKAPPPAAPEPRFICRYPVIWECGTLSGEGELREISQGAVRLRADRAMLSGRAVSIRPSGATFEPAVSASVHGTVAFSKTRPGGFDIGIELRDPSGVLALGWFQQIRQAHLSSFSPLPVLHARGHGLRALKAPPGAGRKPDL
jgi:hypothetical protein